jgi:DNA topoisomerase-1
MPMIQVNGQTITSHESALAADLILVSVEMVGFSRRKLGDKWRYLDTKGRLIRDKADVERINRIGIPPAWADVWICPDPSGHIQATGIDARGRKQYRYHVRWRAVRDGEKFSQMLAFAKVLPHIRDTVKKDLRREGLPKQKILALIVALLDSTLIRVGNEEYAKENDSFGLTTMRGRHVKIRGDKLTFSFRGKSRKHHDISIRDGQLARIVYECKALPGHDLFQYLDDDRKRRSLTSSDVNEYLRTISGCDFSAKDFRTWAGTVLAVRSLSVAPAADTAKAVKRNLIEAFDFVCGRLGNTRAVCRKSYIHPAVTESYTDGSFTEILRTKMRKSIRNQESELVLEESAVLALLLNMTAERADRNKLVS